MPSAPHPRTTRTSAASGPPLLSQRYFASVRPEPPVRGKEECAFTRRPRCFAIASAWFRHSPHPDPAPLRVLHPHERAEDFLLPWESDACAKGSGECARPRRRESFAFVTHCRRTSRACIGTASTSSSAALVLRLVQPRANGAPSNGLGAPPFVAEQESRPGLLLVVQVGIATGSRARVCVCLDARARSQFTAVGDPPGW